MQTTKSLYRLKQASKQWTMKLITILFDIGFSQSKADYLLFTKKEGNSFVALLVYMDGVLRASSDLSTIDSIKASLSA